MDWQLFWEKNDGSRLELSGKVIRLLHQEGCGLLPGELQVELIGKEELKTGEKLRLLTKGGENFCGRITAVSFGLDKGRVTRTVFAKDARKFLHYSDAATFLSGDFASAAGEILAKTNLSGGCSLITSGVTLSGGDGRVKQYATMLEDLIAEHKILTGEQILLRCEGENLHFSTFASADAVTIPVEMIHRATLSESDEEVRTRLRLIYGEETVQVASENGMARWGVLQETQILGSPLTTEVLRLYGDAQIFHLAQEQKSLEIEMAGDWNRRIGDHLSVVLPLLNVSFRGRVTKVEQQLFSGKHITKLTLQASFGA